jgi:phosphoribosylaminoimidazolecarboxamide formyltransferase/IMP cyclohydrolase
MDEKNIKSALISVFSKDGIEPIVKELSKRDVKIYSTGGTYNFISKLGYKVIKVEDITNYPSILGGRVKTLHPKIFGGILSRRNLNQDIEETKKFEIPSIDLVIVDLYPFEKTVQAGSSEDEIIEKIDIGGIALIRAAGKNYNDVTCISSKDDYTKFLDIYIKKEGSLSIDDRKKFALNAFKNSSKYDRAIYNFFNNVENFNLKDQTKIILRYGENPHQKGSFFGDIDDIIEKIHGKELSYNNLLDVDSAIDLISEFKDEKPTFAILKHNNACGLAIRNTIEDAYKDALAADPISAFGGVLISNSDINKSTASTINDLFCEVVIAPKIHQDAIEVLKEKKNRIILILKKFPEKKSLIRSCLNGFLQQDCDAISDSQEILSYPTLKKPNQNEIQDLLFASKISKNTKSNTIVLVKNKQLLASGTGQTSRVDALNQAINKAKKFNFDLSGAVMASDAFFPFPDCAEIAHKAGISSIIQPGGSIKDNLTIDYCEKHNLSMVFTGVRHFKH